MVSGWGYPRAKTGALTATTRESDWSQNEKQKHAFQYYWKLPSSRFRFSTPSTSSKRRTDTRPRTAVVASEHDIPYTDEAQPVLPHSRRHSRRSRSVPNRGRAHNDIRSSPGPQSHPVPQPVGSLEAIARAVPRIHGGTRARSRPPPAESKTVSQGLL